jgi:hypothetical protein
MLGQRLEFICIVAYKGEKKGVGWDKECERQDEKCIDVVNSVSLMFFVLVEMVVIKKIISAIVSDV